MEHTHQNFDSHNHSRSSSIRDNVTGSARLWQHGPVVDRVLRQLQPALSVWSTWRNRHVWLLGMVRFRRKQRKHGHRNYRKNRRLPSYSIRTEQSGTTEQSNASGDRHHWLDNRVERDQPHGFLVSNNEERLHSRVHWSGSFASFDAFQRLFLTARRGHRHPTSCRSLLVQPIHWPQSQHSSQHSSQPAILR